MKIVAAFNRNSAGTVSLGTIDIKVQEVKLYDAAAATTGLTDGILDAFRLGTTGARIAAASAAVAGTDAAGDTYTVATLSVKGFNDAQVAKMITVTEAALKEMTTAATTLGTAKTRVEGQKIFTTSLMDSIERGIGQLVDADMNKESTRLQLCRSRRSSASRPCRSPTATRSRSCRSSGKSLRPADAGPFQER